jgi:uncharacterized protein YjiS (DUF1127 family)
MQFLHLFSRRTIDFCSAAIYLQRLGEEAANGPWQFRDRLKEGGSTTGDRIMLLSLVRFLRARRAYWSVVQELSAYTDRELHDIGIDRADIHEIARTASHEQA